ncbi:MAG TPA: hypothetical protein DCO89_02165, partial [Clostridiales bacterium]|nr:hypothetical protein [Clostridiales bacterium]
VKIAGGSSNKYIDAYRPTEDWNGRFYKTYAGTKGAKIKYTAKVQIPSSGGVSSAYLRIELNGGNYSWNGFVSSTETRTGTWYTLTLTIDTPLTSNTFIYAFVNVNGTGHVYVDDWSLEATFQTTEQEYDSNYKSAEKRGYVFDGWTYLPSGMEAVESVFISGADFDTGVDLSLSSGGFEITARLTSTPSSGANWRLIRDDYKIYGSLGDWDSYTGATSGYMNMGIRSSSSGGMYFTNTGISLTDRNVHTYRYESGRLYVDGVFKGSINELTYASRLYIGSGYSEIYSCKIFNQGKLLRHFIPCRPEDRLSNGLYLYDVVEGKLYDTNGYDGGRSVVNKNTAQKVIANNQTVHASFRKLKASEAVISETWLKQAFTSAQAKTITKVMAKVNQDFIPEDAVDVGSTKNTVFARLEGTVATIYTTAPKVTFPSYCEYFFGGGNSGVYSYDYTSSNLSIIDLTNFQMTSVTTSCSRMFRNLTGLTEIICNGSIDTSNVFNMQEMFYGCTSLPSEGTSGLNNFVSKFNTSNVVYFGDVRTYGGFGFGAWTNGGMFENCKALTSLNLSNFDTSKAVSFGAMFAGCSSLTSINLSGWNTQNVTTTYTGGGIMSTSHGMFEGCSSLTSLDLSSFDTSNMRGMDNMFKGCSSLTTLDLSNFNTSMVGNVVEYYSYNAKEPSYACEGGMANMFYGCSSLRELNISSFNTSLVQDMRSMFYGCSSLSELNISSFNTSLVQDMSSMFYGCSSLTSLNIGNFDTSKVVKTSNMFNGCSSLIALNLSNFDTTCVNDMSAMFSGCSRLVELDISNFNTSYVTNMKDILNGCSNLQFLDLSNFDTKNVKDFRNMFFACSSLISLNISSFDMCNGGVTEGYPATAKDCTENMLYGCSSLCEIYTPCNMHATYILKLPSGAIFYRVDGTGSTQYTSSTDMPVSVQLGKAHNLILNANGASFNSSSVSTETVHAVYASKYLRNTSTGSKITSLPLYRLGFTRSGGWYTSATGGSEVVDSSVVVNSNATVSGWTETRTNGSAVEYVYINRNSPATLYAHWTENKYTIIFTPGTATSGTMDSMTNILYTQDTSLTKCAYSKPGYSFNGWKIISSLEDVYESNGLFYDASTWKSAVSKGANNLYSQVKLFANQGRVKQLSATDGESVTLEAQWGLVDYIIKFNVDGGNPVDDMHYNITTSVTLPETSRTGYIFGGWKFVDETNGGWINSNIYQGEIGSGRYGNVTLQAQWTPITYTIVFNGGEGATGELGPFDACVYDKWYQLRKTINFEFTKTGYTFIGWKITSGAVLTEESKYLYTGIIPAIPVTQLTLDTIIGRDYQVKNLTNVNGSTVTVTAQWEKNPVVITLNQSNATTSAKLTKIHYTFDNEVYFEGEEGNTILADNFKLVPKREKYSFEGYYSEPNGAGTKLFSADGTPLNLYHIIGESITVYPHWVEPVLAIDWASKIIDANLGVTSTSSIKNVEVLVDSYVRSGGVDVSSVNYEGGVYATFDINNLKLTFHTNAELIYLPVDSSNIFAGLTETETIQTNHFDTSRVTKMVNMFAGCGIIKELDLSNFETSLVTSFATMFSGCASIKTLDLSSFVTSSVVNMVQMFINCSELVTLDLYRFEINSSTETAGMLSGCDKIQEFVTPNKVEV